MNRRTYLIAHLVFSFCFLPIAWSADKPAIRLQLSNFSSTNPSAAENAKPETNGDQFVKKGETVDQAVALMGSVRVDGLVRENAVSVFGDVIVGPHGIIQGDAVSVGGKVIREPGSRIEGKIVSMGLPTKGFENFLLIAAPLLAGLTAVLTSAFIVAYSIGFLALVVLVLTLFENQVKGALLKLQSFPIRSFLFGLVGLTAAIPMLLLLIITIIGIPLAFAGAVVLMAAIVLGTVAVGQWVGTAFAEKMKWSLRPVWTGLLGIALLMLVSLIPFIGGMIHIGVHLLGLGAVIQSRFGTGSS